MLSEHNVSPQKELRIRFICKCISHAARVRQCTELDKYSGIFFIYFQVRVINFGLSLLQWCGFDSCKITPHNFQSRNLSHSEQDWLRNIFSFIFMVFLSIIQLCVFVGLFDSYYHLGSSCVSYTSANGIQNTSKASIRKFHRSQVYMIILFSSCLVNFNLFSHALYPFLFIFNYKNKQK